MPEENTANRFDETALPTPVRVFLSSDDVIAKRIAIFNDNKLSPIDALKVGRLLNRIYDKEVAITGLADEVAKILGGNSVAAKKLTLDLAGQEMIAVADYLGDVGGLIRSLGGDPRSFTAPRVILRAMTPIDVVAEALHDNPVSVPAQLEHRVREILESRVRNVRKDEETVLRLTRAEKIGGAEMDEAEARELVQRLAEKIAAVQIAPDQPPPAPPAKAPENGAVNIAVTTQAAPEKSAPAPSFDRSGHGISKEDEHEAEIIRAHVVSKMVTPELADMGRSISDAVEALSAVYGKGLPAEIAARLTAAIESRLRGVRDRAETADLISRSADKGGAGLGSDFSRALSDELEKRMVDIHGQKDASTKKEKEAFVKDSVANAAAKGESRRIGEQEELDRMYSALTGKKRAVPPPQIPSKAPGSDTQAPKPPAPVTTSQAPSPYMYKPPTVAPLPAVPKSMNDIRPSAAAPRLTGPVEELRNMTLADFRRLSADPAEACRKILDKLDLLEEHSFAQRIEGVKAWRESEIYRLYLKIITSSFASGQSIQAIVAAAMSGNESTLTEREVHAIMEMNRKLKA